MPDLLRTVAACIALVGGLVLFTALFTPRRYTAKRPSRFRTGTGLLILSTVLYYLASR